MSGCFVNIYIPSHVPFLCKLLEGSKTCAAKTIYNFDTYLQESMILFGISGNLGGKDIAAKISQQSVVSSAVITEKDGKRGLVRFDWVLLVGGRDGCDNK